MLQRFYSIAMNTFVETVRQPVYGVILVATALLMVLNVSLAAFTLSDDNKLLLDLGLSTLLLSGLFLAAFSAAGVLSREIENKTVLTVISKPVGRPTFLIAKFVGLAAAMAVAWYVSFLIFVLCVRHGVMDSAAKPLDRPVLLFGVGGVLLALGVAAFCNYFYSMGFATTSLALCTGVLTLAVFLIGFFGPKWQSIPFGSNHVSGQVWIGGYLVLLMTLILAAVALTASTRLGQLMTLMVCTLVLVIGIISDYAFGQHAATSFLANVAYAVFPNVGPFWVIDGLTVDSPETIIPVEYVLLTTAYGLLMSAAILNVGIVMFQRREVG
jgi:hypothetical protein